MKRGFTLIEVMIVVAIIGLLASIAIPAYLKTRADSYEQECCNSLRLIRDAQQRYAFQHGLVPVKLGDLCGEGEFFLKEPKCRAGGNYTLYGDKDPTCNLALKGHKL